jgi:hypothetical protein
MAGCPEAALVERVPDVGGSSAAGAGRGIVGGDGIRPEVAARDDDAAQPVEGGEVDQRVSFNDDEVGRVALSQHSGEASEADSRRRAGGRGQEDLLDRYPRVV